MSPTVTTELRPPAKLSIAALAGALVLSVALMIGLHVDDRRLRTAYEADLRERTTEILAHATAEQLRVPLAIGDRELVAQAAEELLRREPRLQGITMRLPSGDVVQVGQAPAQSIARELSLVGPATSTEALLLGATTSSTASSRPLAQLAVHVGDLREGHPTPSIHRVTPWLLLSFPLVGLAGALWFRRRLLRLCEISSRVAEGELDHGPHLGGGDELAWAAAHLHHATAVVAQHVEHVQGRNAALRRDVTLKEDRLQRIAGFAATLVAPLQELDIGQQAVDTLAQTCDVPLVLLFAVGREAAGPTCEAACGISPTLERSNVARGLATTGIPNLDTIDGVTVLPPLAASHPWMVARHVPLSGVVAVPLRFRGRLEGVVVLARRDPWSTTELAFMEDLAPPLAIALANRRAYAASEALARALEHRNDALVQQKERLEVVDRIRAQFVANISHELRTPLNAIIGYTELLADACFGPITDKQQAALDSVLEASNHLLQLVNQVLDLSRAEAGELTTELVECDVLAIARDTARLLEPLTRSRPYEIQVLGARTSVRTDPERVRQILTNLLSNAIKFTRAGSVTVRVDATDDGARLVVEDTGIGIDTAHLELVFEEFRQVDESTTRTHDGAGLGLAISRRLAIALGGSLSVQSTVGQGSTFTLLLPHSAATPAVAAAEPSARLSVAS